MAERFPQLEPSQYTPRQKPAWWNAVIVSAGTSPAASAAAARAASSGASVRARASRSIQPRGFSGGVSPGGNGTRATFSTIETRL